LLGVHGDFHRCGTRHLPKENEINVFQQHFTSDITERQAGVIGGCVTGGYLEE